MLPARRRLHSVERVDEDAQPSLEVEDCRRYVRQKLELRGAVDVAVLGDGAEGSIDCGFVRVQLDVREAHAGPERRRGERAHEHAAVPTQDQRPHAAPALRAQLLDVGRVRPLGASLAGTGTRLCWQCRRKHGACDLVRVEIGNDCDLLLGLSVPAASEPRSFQPSRVRAVGTWRREGFPRYGRSRARRTSQR